MGSSKFYKIAMWCLLALNIGILAVLFLGGRRPGNGSMFLEKATKILQLDETQQQLFTKLAMAHQDSMMLIQSKQTALLKPYFQSSLNDTNAQENLGIMEEIQNLEKQKLTMTSRHFTDIKNLLHEDQLPNYEVFIKGALKNILGKGDRPEPPHRK